MKIPSVSAGKKLINVASHWQETGCSDPNGCEGTDLDSDGNVDIDDLALFVHYWLEKTEAAVLRELVTGLHVL